MVSKTLKSKKKFFVMSSLQYSIGEWVRTVCICLYKIVLSGVFHVLVLHHIMAKLVTLMNSQGNVICSIQYSSRTLTGIGE